MIRPSEYLHFTPRLTCEQIIDGINADERKRNLAVQNVLWRDQPRRKRMKWLAALCALAAVVLFVILMARF